MDQVHFVTQAAVRAAGFDPTTVVQAALSMNPPVGMSLNQHRAVVLGYFTSLAVRYLVASEGEGGAVIRGNAGVVLESLERLLERMP